MTNYGKNFGFRVTPFHGDRSGKHYAVASIPIGVPVKHSGAANNALGLMPMELATGEQVKPKPGMAGIAVYEHLNVFGNDPELTLYSDMSTIPAGAAIQVVSGTQTKVWFKNTADSTFLHQRAYAGRVMVAGIGVATPTIAVGDMLTPGDGDDTGGYWKETSTLANAWLIVTAIDNTRGEVEARLNF